MKPFGWAVIGCGGIAASVAKEILEEGSGRIVACWNRTRTRAEAFAERFGGKVCDTPEEAVTTEGVEGVYIATTHDMHGHFTKLCVEHGVPALCEKPFTVNAKEAKEVLELAKERGVYVSEAMWTWHNAHALTVREWVRSGKIGSVKSVTAKYCVNLTANPKKPRITSRELIAGALLDIGIYPVRYTYELFGMPKSISAEGELVGGVDYSETIVMDYGDFKARLSVAQDRQLGEEFVIEGTEGTIFVPDFHRAKEGTLTGRCNESFSYDHLRYAVQMRHVAEEIRSGKKESAYCPLKATLDTMELLDECRRQMGVVYPCEE